MVIIEEGLNFPGVLGRKNRPATRSWGIGRPFANIPSVRDQGRDPSLLPEEVNPEIHIAGEYETDVHNANSAQLTKHAIFPLLDRPKPFIQKIKSRAPLIPRSKLLGVFGLVGQGKWDWPRDKPLATIPKAMSILSGPEHPVHPEIGKQEISMEW